MGRSEYALFEDRREPVGVLLDAGDILAATADLSSHDVLVRLRALDWDHPCLLVHRAPGEDRWSQVLLGLSSPEPGEGDE